jgi:hypothetical protein
MRLWKRGACGQAAIMYGLPDITVGTETLTCGLLDAGKPHHVLTRYGWLHGTYTGMVATYSLRAAGGSFNYQLNLVRPAPAGSLLAVASRLCGLHAQVISLAKPNSMGQARRPQPAGSSPCTVMCLRPLAGSSSRPPAGMLLMIQSGDLLNHLLRLELFDICLLDPGDVVFSKPLHQQ